MTNRMNLYVSQRAKGIYAGTFEHPFLDLYQAVNFLEQGNQGFKEVTISLREGEYYLKQPIEINANIMEGLNNLKIKNYLNEKVVLTGARKIPVNWYEYKDGIMQADIGVCQKVDALYLDGKRQIMARYPNYEEGKVLGGYAEDCVSPERVIRWKNPAGGYIRALHHAEWGGNSYRILGKDESGELRYEWVGDNNRGSDMHTIKRMVENIFEELDSPGEWFYDRVSGKLFFYPPLGIDVHKGCCEIVTTDELIHIIGESNSKPIANVIISGITFERTHRTLFTGEYERPLRGDWGVVRKGVVFIENAEEITINDCKFTDIGGNAVTLSGYAKNCTVSHSDFNNIGATGVLIIGKMDAVRDASTYDNDNHKTKISDYVPGPKTEDYPRNIVVENSYFYNIGSYEKQTAAIGMSISESVTVRGNTIHHTSRAGINVHDGTFGGHRIEDNDLFDCVTETADHGPINCWGRDRYWSVPQHDAMGYYGKEKRAFALLDAWKTTTIRHNRVYATYAFGIDIDDGASNYDIYDNLCIGVGIKLRDGFDRRVHNNVLIGSNFENHMSFAHNNDLVYSNIVCASKVCNSLCVNKGANTFYSYNIYWNMGNEIKGVPENDFGSLVADPLFEDFSNGNYQVRSESPARKFGFVNFPMSDADFGRPDAPKPPKFVYVNIEDGEPGFQFYDVILSNIVGEGMRSAAGLPDRSGVFVLERDVLGLFCKLGLPIGVGDVIRKMNHIEIKDITDFIAVFDKIELGKTIPIEIYRSQKPMKLTFIKQTNDYTSIKEEAENSWANKEGIHIN